MVYTKWSTLLCTEDNKQQCRSAINVGIGGRVRIGSFCWSHGIWKYRGVPYNVGILEVYGEDLNVLPNSDS